MQLNFKPVFRILKVSKGDTHLYFPQKRRLFHWVTCPYTDMGLRPHYYNEEEAETHIAAHIKRLNYVPPKQIKTRIPYNY